MVWFSFYRKLWTKKMLGLYQVDLFLSEICILIALQAVIQKILPQQNNDEQNVEPLLSSGSTPLGS